MDVHPAPENHGIVFERIDLHGPQSARCIKVGVDALIEANLCTKLGNAHGATVSTVEHLMAALAGCGIHNARIVLNGPEVPILDGSASAPPGRDPHGRCLGAAGAGRSAFHRV